MLQVLTFWIAIVHGDLLVLEFVPPVVGHLHGRMGRIIRKISKKWFVSLVRLLHERNRLVGKIVDTKAFTSDNAAVVLLWRAEIITPVPGAKSVKLIKAAAVGVIRILHAIMPLAEGSSGIASDLERIADGLLIKIQPFTTG